ncbi:MAG: tail fiber domain-containing protein [Ferruginibacter sp.]|nr:tail fiber domain-containing protein [Ferruginibacter sp.]
MKHLAILSFIFWVMLLPFVLNAQSVGINTTGDPAHSSSILDVTSTEKGVLVPRMDKAQKLGISNPATGLLVFQNGPDSIGFHYYDGTGWTWLSNANQSLDTTAWLVGGNVGLQDTSFIGHRDNVPLQFRQNNIITGYSDYFRFNYFLGRYAGNPAGTGHLAMGDSSGNAAGHNFPSTFLGIRSGVYSTGVNNTFVGAYAGQNTTTGGYNVFMGTASGRYNLTGEANAYMGMFSGTQGTTAGYNAAFGYATLSENRTSNFNVAMGLYSLRRHRRNGNAYNTAIGSFAMEEDTASYANVAVGTSALRLNRNTNGNTALGTNTLNNHISGDYNTAIGYESMIADTTGALNTAMGWRSLRFNRNGSENTALGVGALEFSDSAAQNTIIGRGAMIGVSGDRGEFGNVAVGFYAAGLSSGTRESIAIGRIAGYRNRGNNNIFIGTSSGYGLSPASGPTGIENTAVGAYSYAYGTTGRSNSMLGLGAMYFNTTGSGNVAIGVRSLHDNIVGSANIAIGDSSLFNNVNSNQNTAIGRFSLFNNNNGSGNTAIGFQSGTSNVAGSSNTFVGNNANVNSPGLINATALGANAYAARSNSIVLGSIAGENGATNTVNVGIGTNNPLLRLHVVRAGTASTVYNSSSAAVFEGNGTTYVQVNAPDNALSGIISGNQQTSLRSGLMFPSDSSMQFRTGGNFTRMTVANTGFVGIGTTAPLTKLHVYENTATNPNIRIASASSAYEAGVQMVKSNAGSDWRMYVDVSGYLNFARSTDDFATDGTDYFTAFTSFLQPTTDNFSRLGGPSNRWTTVYAIAGTINTSDARQKQNIRDLNYGLKELMQLRPVSFEWKENPQWGNRIGFIAQEVQPILSEVVQKGELKSKKEILNDLQQPAHSDTDMLGIYYSDIIPVAVKAIQEQQKTIEKQQEEIEFLKKQQEVLNQQLEEIKKKVGL